MKVGTTRICPIFTIFDRLAKARITLDDIIDHIPEGELRASFVALPEVQRLLLEYPFQP